VDDDIHIVLLFTRPRSKSCSGSHCTKAISPCVSLRASRRFTPPATDNPPSLMPFATARASLLGAGADQFALLTDISNG
jgi:hypothetical protein